MIDCVWSLSDTSVWIWINISAHTSISKPTLLFRAFTLYGVHRPLICGSWKRHWMAKAYTLSLLSPTDVKITKVIMEEKNYWKKKVFFHCGFPSGAFAVDNLRRWVEQSLRLLNTLWQDSHQHAEQTLFICFHHLEANQFPFVTLSFRWHSPMDRPHFFVFMFIFVCFLERKQMSDLRVLSRWLYQNVPILVIVLCLRLFSHSCCLQINTHHIMSVKECIYNKTGKEDDIWHSIF